MQSDMVETIHSSDVGVYTLGSTLAWRAEQSSEEKHNTSFSLHEHHSPLGVRRTDKKPTKKGNIG